MPDKVEILRNAHDGLATLECNKLRLQLVRADIDYDYDANGDRIRIPQGTVLGRLDFRPLMTNDFVEGTRYTILVRAMNSFEALFAELDTCQPKIEQPEYMTGNSPTNIQMARLAKHAGFFHSEDPGGIGFVNLVGRTEDVRKRITSLKSNTQLLERVLRRAAGEEARNTNTQV